MSKIDIVENWVNDIEYKEIKMLERKRCFVYTDSHLLFLVYSFIMFISFSTA